MDDIDAEINQIIKNMSEDLNKYKAELQSKLLDKVNSQIKYVQSALQDLSHVPEELERTDKDLDMYGGYLFYKDFQGVRLHRRRLKNQKEKIESLINLDIEGFINNQAEEVVSKCSKRTYSARVHNDLAVMYKSHGRLCSNKTYEIKIKSN